FAVRRNESTGEIEVLDQTLEDGRSGQFFNVDFVNTVGETGMNCGGITSTVDGRIWTAEEWFRSDNGSISDDGEGVQDTTDFTISTDIPGDFDGAVISKFENFNYMVEIDPRQGVAIRKQYNWGRQPFEGGCILPDNQTVYLGADDTPGYFTRFVADTPGDFTQGTTSVYSESLGWIEMDNTSLEEMLNFKQVASEAGATCFNRIEWVTYDPVTEAVYFTETGRDNPGSRWADEVTDGAEIASHHISRAAIQGTDALEEDYVDYYGRVMKYDPETSDMSVVIEGGPDYDSGVNLSAYPDKHLSNPDGLNVMEVNGQSYLIICEDLNGTSNGRMPNGISNRTCELWLLDLSIGDATPNDLVRIAAVPLGAEVTGAVATPDGKSLLVNSQHPAGDLEFPYNNSLTFAINGLDQLILGIQEEGNGDNEEGFFVYPNPTNSELNFDKLSDIAIYDNSGKRLKVYRNVKTIDISDLAPAMYFVQNQDGLTQKVIVQ
ncbi:MAG: alkaline phosphatase PhoX, partial [Cryomorphaceae bacterium]